MKRFSRVPISKHVVVPRSGGGVKPRTRNGNGRLRKKRSDADD